MATTQRYSLGHPFFDNNGTLLASGSLTYYRAGTTTLLNIYSDAAGSTALPNPLTLNSAGRAVDGSSVATAIYLSDQGFNYKELIKNSSGTTLYTEDNIPEPVDPGASLSDFAKPITAASTDTGATVTLTASDAGNARLANTASNSITYSLPSAATVSNGKPIIVKKTNDANTVTLDADGVDLIDGAGTLVLNNKGDTAWLMSTGAGWESILYSRPLTGSVIAHGSSTVPTGWLECNGAAVSRTTYAALFVVIGDDFGTGDGSTTFNVPDLRGEFIRGWDHAKGSDPNAASRTDRGDGTTGDNVGTKQADEFELHGHPARYSNTTGGANGSGAIMLDTDNQQDVAAFTGTRSATLGEQITGSGGSETRPRNVNMMYIIKY